MKQKPELIRKGIFQGGDSELYRVLLGADCRDRTGRTLYVFELHSCDETGWIRNVGSRPAYRFAVCFGMFKPQLDSDGRFYFLDILTHSVHHNEDWFVRAQSLNSTSRYRGELEDWLTALTMLHQKELEGTLDRG